FYTYIYSRSRSTPRTTLFPYTTLFRSKKELIRIVRNKEGEVFVDLSGKKNGRGAYLSNDPKVIDQAEQSNVLGKQLNANIDPPGDRKSTRLNSSHVSISYAVFCLKKKK